MENRSYIRIETESGPCWAEERGGEACLLTAAPFFGGVDTGWRRPLESVRLLAEKSYEHLLETEQLSAGWEADTALEPAR